MIRLIEARNFRCLRYVHQPLSPFHVLVGPNASGKTTFLDVVAFLGRLVSDGVDAAVQERTQNLWLESLGFWRASTPKPSRPKEAMEAVLRRNRKPRSSSIYRGLAEKVSFQRCTDRAFVKLADCLRRWFGEIPA